MTCLAGFNHNGQVLLAQTKGFITLRHANGMKLGNYSTQVRGKLSVFSIFPLDLGTYHVEGPLQL